ncbi:Spore germination protein B3 precursor [compost metagenome]
MVILHKRIANTLLLICMLFTLTGCWDRTETNDIAFILSSSIDLEENGLFRVSYLLPLPGQMGGASGGGGGTSSGGNSYYIDSEVGRTFQECTFKLQKRIGRKLFLAHRRVIVLGEEFAKHGITPLFDAVPRLPDSRLNTSLIVTKGKGYDLLKAQPKFERFPTETIRELSKSSQAVAVSTKEVGVALSFKSDPIITYMKIKESQKDLKPSKEIELVGYAQFYQDKMVGIFEDRSANGLINLLDKTKEHMITFPMKADKNMSILVISGQTHITPKLENGKVSFDIHLELTSKVREDLSDQDLNKSSISHKVELMLAEQGKKNVQAALKQMQAKGTDSAQLGLAVWRKYPYEWDNGIRDNWRELFKQADFQVVVHAVIEEAGLINQNVLKEESNQ